VQDKNSNQTARVFLNYYPCSYGDTLAAMFSGIIPDWTGKRTQGAWGDFKFPEFYSLSLEDKISFWQQFPFNFITCCHRQNGFNFNAIEPVQVISIRVNDRTWLHNRVMKLQWNNFEIKNPVLEQIRTQLSQENHYKIVEAEYIKWSKQNILESDLVLDFEIIKTDKLVDWCKQHNLGYSQDTVNLIKNDLKKYQ
jgi:hypothetical protein